MTKDKQGKKRAKLTDDEVREHAKAAKRAYESRCRKEGTIRRLVVTLYPPDEDIRSKIDEMGGYSAYIKGLIRADIARNG